MNSRRLLEKTGLTIDDFVTNLSYLLSEFDDVDLIYMLQCIEAEIEDRQQENKFMGDL